MPPRKSKAPPATEDADAPATAPATAEEEVDTLGIDAFELPKATREAKYRFDFCYA
jgi:hypothetical protein